MYFDGLVIDFLKRERELEHSSSSSSSSSSDPLVGKNIGISLQISNTNAERTHSTYPWEDTAFPSPQSSLSHIPTLLLSSTSSHSHDMTLEVEDPDTSETTHGSIDTHTSKNILLPMKDKVIGESPADDTFLGRTAPVPLPVSASMAVPVSVSVPVSENPLNMFWIKKSELPCIRTDSKNGQVKAVIMQRTVPLSCTSTLQIGRASCRERVSSPV